MANLQTPLRAPARERELRLKLSSMAIWISRARERELTWGFKGRVRPNLAKNGAIQSKFDTSIDMTGKPFRVDEIRHKRPKPQLKWQHFNVTKAWINYFSSNKVIIAGITMDLESGIDAKTTAWSGCKKFITRAQEKSTNKINVINPTINLFNGFAFILFSF